ncbi:MAG: prepilin-type N-terminal cleavage/methylation domain-containing protein [Candidatus Moraniibacteriota bacterium]
MVRVRKIQRGFTLIEVMIVIAIIGITSALVFVSLATGKTGRLLERSSREVIAGLREAQNYAVSGRSTAINENNTSFGVQIVSATAYNVISSSGTVSSYSLKEGVNFASGVTTLGFMVPRGDVTVAGVPLAAGASYRIDLSKSGSTVHICLYQSGRIVENGGNATCP